MADEESTDDSDSDTVIESEPNDSAAPLQNEVGSNMSELPHVIILHDSVLNGVDPKRLGHSYGLNVTMKKSPTAKQCILDITPNNPEAVLIHIGVNELKTHDAETASDKVYSAVQNLRRELNPNSKIIVSKTTVTLKKELSRKAELYNALLHTKLHEMDNISFVGHDNLRIDHHLKDEIHPNKRGAGILAGNIGRHLENLLWEKATRKTGSSRKNRPYYKKRGYRQQRQEHNLENFRQERGNRQPHNTDSENNRQRNFVPGDTSGSEYNSNRANMHMKRNKGGARYHYRFPPYRSRYSDTPRRQQYSAQNETGGGSNRYSEHNYPAHQDEEDDGEYYYMNRQRLTHEKDSDRHVRYLDRRHPAHEEVNNEDGCFPDSRRLGRRDRRPSRGNDNDRFPDNRRLGHSERQPPHGVDNDYKLFFPNRRCPDYDDDVYHHFPNKHQAQRERWSRSDRPKDSYYDY